MSHVIQLPSRLDEYGMYNLFSQVAGPDGYPIGTELCIDFSWLSWADPVGIASLHNGLAWLFAHGVKISFRGVNISIQAHRYLDDAGFFKEYLGKGISPSCSVRQSTFPVVRVEHSNSHAWLVNNFMPWLCRELRLNTAQLATMQTCVRELFNNIQDHSSKTIGCIFAQHFPNKGRIQIAISDFGVGIPTTVRRVHSAVNDADALTWAVTDGFTSKSLPTNAGAGLGILLRSVVALNRGIVRIYSGGGVLTSEPCSDGMAVSAINAIGHYPGTLIELTIRTDTFVPDDDEREDMEW